MDESLTTLILQGLDPLWASYNHVNRVARQTWFCEDEQFSAVLMIFDISEILSEREEAPSVGREE